MAGLGKPEEYNQIKEKLAIVKEQLLDYMANNNEERCMGLVLAVKPPSTS